MTSGRPRPDGWGEGRSSDGLGRNRGGLACRRSVLHLHRGRNPRGLVGPMVGLQVRPCSVCGWRPVRGQGERCNADRLFYLRHGRDRTVEEVGRAWNLAIDRVERILARP